MIDIHLLRKEPEETQRRLRRKLAEVECSPLLAIDAEMREQQAAVDTLRSERKILSDGVGTAKKAGEDTARLVEQVNICNAHLVEREEALRLLQEQRDDLLARLPNIPDDDVPDGDRPEDNVVLRTWGEMPTFAFASKNHLELNEGLELFDFERGVKLAGSGWVAYRHMGARLEWALLQYMLNHHFDRGYRMWMTPHVVRQEISFGAGQLPKFADQQFQIENGEHLCYLIPTAEVPLTGLHAGEILSADTLPLRYVAYSPCFRREAGAAGSNERGLIRTHQFNKVEMYALCAPEDSDALLEELIKSAEAVLEGLGLHYRSVLLAAGDTTFASAKTVDIEVYLPGQKRYYEVSSVSNCRDFQARRTPLRFRRGQKEKPELVHTLNGSGVATSRLMVALIENNQQEDGSVVIPEALRPYLGGQERLTPQV